MHLNVQHKGDPRIFADSGSYIYQKGVYIILYFFIIFLRDCALAAERHACRVTASPGCPELITRQGIWQAGLPTFHTTWGHQKIEKVGKF